MPLTLHARRVLGHDAPDYLTERLDAVPRRHLNLSVDGKGGCHRPDLSIRPATDEDQPPALVSVTIGALFGQQTRYLDLMPDEARALARHLIETADVIEREVAGAAQHLQAAE